MRNPYDAEKAFFKHELPQLRALQRERPEELRKLCDRMCRRLESTSLFFVDLRFWGRNRFGSEVGELKSLDD